MNKNAANLLNQAIECFQRRDLESAEHLVQKVLKKGPRNSDALHLLGVIKGLRNDVAGAIKLFRKAAEIDSGNSIVHFNLAKALSDSDKDGEAILHHRKATTLDPRFYESWQNYGLSLQKLGRYQEALECYDKAISLSPSTAILWSNRGATLNSLQRHGEALGSCQKAITLDPNLAEALHNLGASLARLDRHEEAVAAYGRAISLNPRHAASWLNLGTSLIELKRHEDALALYKKQIDLDLDIHQAWSGYGIALNQLGRYNEALASFDKALRIDPAYCEAWSNRGATLTYLKRFEEALTCFERAIAINPDFADAHYNESFCHLTMLNFAKGWPKLEWRWKSRSAKSRHVNFGKPMWPGDPVGRLLLWCDQGIGDEILWSSLLSNLRERAAEIIVETDPRLIPLFQRSFAGIQFLPRGNPIDEDLFDAHSRIDSLGQYFLNDIGSFKLRTYPYLKACVDKSATLRTRLQKPGRIICGLSWLSSRNAKFGHAKSINLKSLAPILKLPHLEFVDLQYGNTSNERETLERETGIKVKKLEDVDNLNDLDGFTSLVDACDLIVTISNSTAHIAGALGKETLLLVPNALGKLFYWQGIANQSLWYPSVQLFQQAASGDWDDAIAEIACRLQTWQQ